MEMCGAIKIDRIWAMPSRYTFLIKPIAALLKEEMGSGLWIDPFCGENSPAQITNDLNLKVEAQFHLDAVDFLKKFGDASVDGVLYDPPYSVRQVAECYKACGYIVTQETTRADFYTKIRDEIARVVKPGGKVLSFGWNSLGVGKVRGFEMTRIRLVPHGGCHNDTICTVEVKILGGKNGD